MNPPDQQQPPLTVAGERIQADWEANRGRFAGMHERAAQLDGIVKILIGLVLVVFSATSLIVGLVAVHALIRHQVMHLLALILGLPGLIGALVGLVMLGIGGWKAITSRGRG